MWVCGLEHRMMHHARWNPLANRLSTWLQRIHLTNWNGWLTFLLSSMYHLGFWIKSHSHCVDGPKNLLKWLCFHRSSNRWNKKLFSSPSDAMVSMHIPRRMSGKMKMILIPRNLFFVQLNSRKSVRWSAVPVPCWSSLWLRLREGAEQWPQRGRWPVLSHILGIFSWRLGFGPKGWI